jgi:hypothetical protein
MARRRTPKDAVAIPEFTVRQKTTYPVAADKVERKAIGNFVRVASTHNRQDARTPGLLASWRPGVLAVAVSGWQISGLFPVVIAAS